MLIYKHKKRRFLLLLIFLLLFGIILYCVHQLKAVFNTLSQSKIYALSLQTINNVINNKMSTINYNELINYQKKDNEEITIVNTNIVLMNKLANEISNDIIKELNSMGSLYVSIPIGSITGNELLSGTGPSFKINFVPVSEVRTEFKTDFHSTGINQTKHKIFLDVFCDVEALSAFSNNSISIEIQIPILETVIIGGVPNTYYHLQGLENGNLLDVLE